MKTYIALLRGINVGGNNRISMADLKQLCINCGFRNVRTYINSGNVVFESNNIEGILTDQLEKALLGSIQKPIQVIIRTVDDLKLLVQKNPFVGKDPKKTGITFFKNRLPKSFQDTLKNHTNEEVVVRNTDVYIYFPVGMGKSKLRFSNEDTGYTMRNINTVQNLIVLSDKG